MIESFEALPDEKRERVIHAALSAFGHKGFRKASIADIAAAAGVSKAMIFYWFESKHKLYEYLAMLCGSRMLGEVSGKLDDSVTDFFERIRTASETKMAMLRQTPALLAFFKNIYLEPDPEAGEVIDRIKAMSEGVFGGLFVGGVDTSKFKDGVDAELIFRFAIWASEGFVSELGEVTVGDVDSFIGEFYRCMDMLKQHLYKEEYL